MRISVIIPTRNRYDHINFLIDDLLKQEASEFEIIVVDQSDNPEDLMHCTQIITSTLGPCISRNLGAQKAVGELLVFLDDDARIRSNFITEITAPIINQGFKAAAGAICDIEGNYTKADNSFMKSNSNNFIKVITTNPDSPKSRISMAFPAGCSAITADVFRELGGFNDAFDPTGAGEDRDMALNLYYHGYSIWYNANAKLLHAEASHGGSRDVGSRSIMLDVHTYIMCKSYFSLPLAYVLRRTIMNQYRRNFIRAVLNFKQVRTRYMNLLEIKKRLKQIDNNQ